jgi:flagellar export protein FliJ
MSFRFRLAKVLRLRRRDVDRCALAVKLAAEELATCTANLTAIQQTMARLSTAAAPHGSAAGVVWRRQRAAWLQQRAGDLAVAVAERDAAAERLSQARDRLREAHRRQEVLEGLRRRQEQAWRAVERRRERKRFDEIAALRAARNHRADLA